MERKLPPNSPRYQAGSFELAEGEGPIICMQPCGEFLEIYKSNNTFRVRTPESNHPEQINPNAMWTASCVANVGSSNIIVARVFLQGCELLQSAIFDSEFDKDALIKLLHGIKESILLCERAYLKINNEHDSIIEKIESGNIRIENGRMFNSFPQIENFEEQVTSFLINAKRSLVQIAQMPSQYVDIPSRGANFHKLGQQLALKWGEDSDTVKFIKSMADGAKRIVDLRNYQEHPGEIATHIENIKLRNDNVLVGPCWYLADEPPRFILQEMNEIISFLINVCEVMHIHLLLQNISKKFPFVLVKIDEKDVDERKPIIYRLSLDMSKLKFK